MNTLEPEELLIIGTGGLAKEMAQLARQIDPSGQRWDRISYVAENSDSVGQSLPYGTVRYTDQTLLERTESADVVVAVGQPKVRQRLGQQLGSSGLFRFPNLIHPDVQVDPLHVRLGKGNVLTKGVVLTCDIVIGDFNLVNWNATVGHDATLGSYNVLNPGSNVSGHVKIGDSCLIGVGAIILERLQIANGTVIGAGAVVTKSVVRENGTYVGVPARLKLPGAGRRV